AYRPWSIGISIIRRRWCWRRGRAKSKRRNSDFLPSHLISRFFSFHRNSAFRNERRCGANGSEHGQQHGAHHTDSERKTHPFLARFIRDGDLTDITFMNQLLYFVKELFAVYTE